MRIGMIQMTSSAKPKENLQYIREGVEALAVQGAELISTPENALVFGQRSDYHSVAERLGEGELQSEFQALAKLHQVWLHIGSFPIRQGNGVSTTTLIYSPDGELAAHYDKLHLFDVDVEDKQGSYRESDTFTYGNKISLLKLPSATLGLTICYDLRFPALFNELRLGGADVILVPAAFTAVTGKAHWETLLRARAIENQCFIIAVNQGGTHNCGRETWGHSMVIDPWGEVIASLEQDAKTLLVDLDLEQVATIRKNMPLTEHNRFRSELKKEPIK
ncbi:carbon-nitrogen hydrolase family protein [Vibrio nigripulchritudo]|uniref:carbon-nitrogen hydrolase family protein n=1 Tax=Vibrio nigripulchritudo TaxID=28173 RepID=UPI0005FA5D7E|nr:carbon-nitrogen hydrolase family protein [Vibrio nigripulchritudo]KJY79925.1 amidohydrolase [Vibrio nigripulchritudo]